MLINKIKLSDSVIGDGYVNIPILSNFSIDTQQYEDIEKNFDLTSSDIINPVIDYEKVKLLPMGAVSYALLNENESFEIMENGSNSETESYNDIYTHTPEKSDGLLFRLHFTNPDSIDGWDQSATKLSDVGFTEDDVNSRKKKVSSTFIRLSFYDSKDLKTQNLLYYSTIFLDADSLYSDYISNNSTMDELRMEFKVENPILSNKVKSFEGFNIFLFKNDVPKNKTKTIYLRVDFNNAGNGRSTLFLNSKPISTSGYTMQELYDNLFIEIDCIYDYIEHKYLYFVKNLYNILHKTNDTKVKNFLKLELYQAKVI